MNYFVEILKAIAWPAAILTIVLFFFFKFRGAFDFFLRNIRKVHFPGGSVETQNTFTNSGEAPKENREGIITPTKEQTEYLEEYIKKIRDERNIINEEKQDLQKELANVEFYMFAWKFEYLELFYVSHTKRVLLWFANNSPQTKENYYKAWQFLVPLPTERNTIIEVLVRYDMLERDGVNIRITEQGYSFLQYIGYVPCAPGQK